MLQSCCVIQLGKRFVLYLPSAFQVHGLLGVFTRPHLEPLLQEVGCSLLELELELERWFLEACRLGAVGPGQNTKDCCHTDET